MRMKSVSGSKLKLEDLKVEGVWRSREEISHVIQMELNFDKKLNKSKSLIAKAVKSHSTNVLNELNCLKVER